MTKAELIEKIARSRDLPPNLSKKCIGQVLDIAFQELAGYFVKTKLTRTNVPRFAFPGFGTFTKKRRRARRGVNPRTLEPMEIEACCTIDFKASAELRDNLNSGRLPARLADGKAQDDKTDEGKAKPRDGLALPAPKLHRVRGSSSRSHRLRTG